MLTAQGTQPLFARPWILLDIPAEEQPSYQPAGRGLGTEKTVDLGPLFGGQGEDEVICPPFRMRYPNLEQATTFGVTSVLCALALTGILQSIFIKKLTSLIKKATTLIP